MSIADFTTHQNIATAAVLGVGSRVTAKAAVSELQIRVTAGLQAGAIRRLRASQLRVGGHEGNDLILLENDIADEHVRLEFQRSLFGSVVSVTALAPGVIVNGKPCVPGKPLSALELPLELVIGESTVVLERPHNTHAGAMAQAHQWWNGSRLSGADPVLMLAFLALILLLMLSLAFTFFPWKDNRHAVLGNDVSQELIMASVAARDWQGELEAQLRDHVLADELTVTSKSDGLLSVTGNIPTAKMPAVRDVQVWYDSQSGAPAIVWGFFQQTGLRNIPDIMMVKLSGEPRLILTTGESRGVDQVLVDDWVITAMDDKDMTLSRGSEKLVVAYKDLADEQ